MRRQFGKRMRFLLETYAAIRAAVGKDFLVGVKLNSADSQKGSFDESKSAQVVQKLSEMGIDFIEVSGGNYETPAVSVRKPQWKTPYPAAIWIWSASPIRLP